MVLKIPQNKDVKGLDAGPSFYDASSEAPLTERGGYFSDFAPPRVVQGPISKIWNSISLRFGGIQVLTASLISPLTHSKDPEAVAPIFLKEKGPELKELADRYPLAVNRAVKKETENVASPWKEFLRIVSGDRAAVLDAVKAFEPLLTEQDQKNNHFAPSRMSRLVTECAVNVAGLRPSDGGYLLRGLFEYASDMNRLKIIKAFDNDLNLGSNRELGNLFLKLMARTTPEERQSEIYPEFAKIVEAKEGRPFLKALIRGWLAEDETQSKTE